MALHGIRVRVRLRMGLGLGEGLGVRVRVRVGFGLGSEKQKGVVSYTQVLNAGRVYYFVVSLSLSLSFLLSPFSFVLFFVLYPLSVVLCTLSLALGPLSFVLCPCHIVPCPFLVLPRILCPLSPSPFSFSCRVWLCRTFRVTAVLVVGWKEKKRESSSYFQKYKIMRWDKGSRIVKIWMRSVFVSCL
jgi:hypothetical protein